MQLTRIDPRVSILVDLKVLDLTHNYVSSLQTEQHPRLICTLQVTELPAEIGLLANLKVPGPSTLTHTI